MRIPHLIVAGLACTLLVGAALLAAEELTVERLVRQWTAGVPVAELKLQIREHPGGFELDGDLEAELNAIGFPESLLRLMRIKNNTIVRDRAAGEEARAEAERLDGSLLRVRFNPDQKRPKKRRLLVNAEVDDLLIQQWKLPRFAGTRFEDVAVFLACGTPQHVPDGWRQKTPLDYRSEILPRHRILALNTGADRGETRHARIGFDGTGLFTDGRRGAATVTPRFDGRRDQRLVYDLPETLEASLEPGVAHDLHVGLALKVGETFYPWTVSAIPDLTLTEEPLELDAVVRGLANPSVDAIDLDLAEGDQHRFRTVRVCRKGCPVR